MKLNELPGDRGLIARLADAGGLPIWVTGHAGDWYPLRATLSDLCAAGHSAARGLIDQAATGQPLHALHEYTLLAPIDDTQEVWAAGVTYERSKTARIEESGAVDLYSAVYSNARPELFFKAIGARAVGTGYNIGIRADASWSVPEPELAVVFDAAGETFGFAIGDDVSSRDIEGANALYLPQAKVYDRSCALGPAIVPVWTLDENPVFDIELEILRGGRQVYFSGTSTAQLHRHWDDLSRWLRACLTFDRGVILLTGTGIVPSDNVSLLVGDEVVVKISDLGELRNSVETSGAAVES
jgi:2-dehydro-3-deoxy-D-arabinonate dehydratase